MQKESWRLAAQQLKEDTSTASDKQKNIAKLAGITLSRHTPRLVAAAQLRLALVKDLHLKVRLDEQEHSRSVIEELWQGARKAPTPTVEEEAKAWIEHLFMLKRREAILKLRPEPGDVVADFFCGGGSFLAVAQGLRRAEDGNLNLAAGKPRRWLLRQPGKAALGGPIRAHPEPDFPVLRS